MIDGHYDHPDDVYESPINEDTADVAKEQEILDGPPNWYRSKSINMDDYYQCCPFCEEEGKPSNNIYCGYDVNIPINREPTLDDYQEGEFNNFIQCLNCHEIDINPVFVLKSQYDSRKESTMSRAQCPNCTCLDLIPDNSQPQEEGENHYTCRRCGHRFDIGIKVPQQPVTITDGDKIDPPVEESSAEENVNGGGDSSTISSTDSSQIQEDNATTPLVNEDESSSENLDEERGSNPIGKSSEDLQENESITSPGATEDQSATGTGTTESLPGPRGA